jgi:hypothetical protein
MRVEGDTAYGRTGGADWQKVQDFTSGFAPGRDPLAYLNGPRSITEVPAVAGSDTRQFSFRVDGPAFAEFMRQQLEDELRRTGKLPAGVSLDTPRVYRDVAGEGTLVGHSGMT